MANRAVGCGLWAVGCGLWAVEANVALIGSVNIFSKNGYLFLGGCGWVDVAGRLWLGGDGWVAVAAWLWL